MIMPLVTVNDLRISFSNPQVQEVVKGISFTLEKNKTLAIVGESGSGKSLLALSLIGLLPKDAIINQSLSISIGNNSISIDSINEKDWQLYRGKIMGMVFQEPMSALNPIQCVGQQIQECILQHQKISTKQANQQAVDWLGKVKLAQPDKIYNRYPHQLSGGQKQRVMIAMAMCNKPDLLIADEPSTALDASVQQEIIQLMQALQTEMGSALIFITHDLGLAAEIADDILVLHQGKLIEYGRAEQIIQHPQEAYTKALINCRPNLNNKGKKLPVIADYMIGNMEPIALPELHPIKSDNILSVRDLRIWYPTGKNLLGKTNQYYKAVQGISFDLALGKTLGLVGESGCGKSSIGKALMGLAPIHSGSIRFKDKEIAGYRGKEWNSVRAHMQLIFQDPFASLNPRKNIADIISEPLIIQHGIKGQALQQETARLLELVQLPQSAAQRYPHQFSGGQRQRIGIARALALKAKVLICDESVSALDVSVQAQILNLLKSLQYELQLAYLFISHDLSVIHYMSDEIIVMQKGQLVEKGSADAILKQPQASYTQALINAMY
jgi:peptide/nickel transport system ATP-binding protein